MREVRIVLWFLFVAVEVVAQENGEEERRQRSQNNQQWGIKKEQEHDEPSAAFELVRVCPTLIIDGCQQSTHTHHW